MAHYSTRTAEQEVGTAAWAAEPHAEADYFFDTAGWLVVPGALDAAARQGARADPSALGADATLRATCARIFGGEGGFTPTERRLPHAGAATGGIEAFVGPAAAVLSEGLSVVCALGDEAVSPAVVVTGSHKSLVEAPPGVFDDPEVSSRPTLQPGDLLLVAAETLLRFLPTPTTHLLQFRRVPAAVAPSEAAPEVAAGWFAEAPRPAAEDPDATAQADPEELWFWDTRGVRDPSSPSHLSPPSVFTSC